MSGRCNCGHWRNFHAHGMLGYQCQVLLCPCQRFTPQPNPTSEETSMSDKETVVRMPGTLHEAVKRVADEQGRSMAETIRTALWAYVDQTNRARR